MLRCDFSFQVQLFSEWVNQICSSTELAAHLAFILPLLIDLLQSFSNEWATYSLLKQLKIGTIKESTVKSMVDTTQR